MSAIAHALGEDSDATEYYDVSAVVVGSQDEGDGRGTEEGPL